MAPPVGQRLTEALVVALKRSPKHLDAAIRQALAVPPLADAKADRAPTINLRSYEEVVSSSKLMTEEQKKYWLGQDNPAYTWRDIRLKARECHAKAFDAAKGDRRASCLVSAALELDDLQLDRYEPGTKAGEGVYGFLDRPALIVNLLSGQAPEDEAVIIAHEIGHFKLHLDPRQEVTVLAPGLGGDSIDTGAAQVHGYSPGERKEVQADVFAGEFLCPTDWLREEALTKAGVREKSQ